MDERPVYIYALVDPRDDTVRYIGQTVQPDTRLSAHLQAPGPQVAAWVADLKALDQQPQMRILETTDRAHAGELEHAYTARYIASTPRTWGGARPGAGRNAGPPKITRLIRLDPATDAAIRAARRGKESYGAVIDRLVGGRYGG